MLRVLFSAGAILVLVLSMCLLPQTATARRCPVKEPETLLSLYQNSDAIYRATYDKTVEGEVVENTEDYTSVEIAKHFTISSTLKGEPRKFLVLEDREYRYKTSGPDASAEADESAEEAAADRTDEPENESDGEEELEEEENEALESSETVLLFVRNGEEKEQSPGLTDYRDGVKRLSADDLRVYEERIRELGTIFSAKKVNENSILDWLVRCAEEEATRWEGTFELVRSVRNQRWREQAAERHRERIEKGLPVEEGPVETEDEDPGEEESSIKKNVDSDRFAKLIDPNHKLALANILLSRGRNERVEGGKIKEVAGDRELIELIAHWGDPRLVDFLLDRIRTGAGDPADTSDLMGTIAEILDDDTVSAIAEKYSDTRYEEDDDAVEEDDKTADAEESDAAVSSDEDQPDLEKAAAVETSAETVKPQDPANGKAKQRKITYKELRAKLLAEFLAACDEAAKRESTEKS